MTVSVDSKRTKRFHTRSRAGCTTCRQRHIRCDEQLPICGNCVSSSKACSWARASIPLREQRTTKYPGEQAPWATLTDTSQSSPSTSVSISPMPSAARKQSMSSSVSFKLVLGEALDPFDTMHIMMPYRSKELFHYYYHTASCFGNLPGTQKYATAHMHDPYAFRNVLLIAGLHYAWNVGELSSFDSTFLFHKVQSIRTINKWIESCTSSNVTLCMRHIATLCVVECCLGNFETAETHLNGLMLFLDTKEAHESVPSTSREEVDREFAERYLIMAFNLVHSLKSRFDDFMMSNSNSTASSRQMNPQEIANLIHEWHMHEAAGILPRLRAMNMFPSFFSPIYAGTQIQQIDVRPILCCMQEITGMFDLRYSEPYHGTSSALPNNLWATSGPSKLLSAVISAHISSIREHSDDRSESPDNLKSSWSGICIGVGLYLTSVLGIWNRGQPAENRLLRHVLIILRQDLDGTFSNVLGDNIAAQNLWFWKAFLGALSLAHVTSSAGTVEDYARVLNLVPYFNHYIRTWAGIMRISMWQHARDRLDSIVFPINFQREALAEAMWNRALSISQTSTPDKYYDLR